MARGIIEHGGGGLTALCLPCLGGDFFVTLGVQNTSRSKEAKGHAYCHTAVVRPSPVPSLVKTRY